MCVYMCLCSYICKYEYIYICVCVYMYIVIIKSPRSGALVLQEERLVVLLLAPSAPCVLCVSCYFACENLVTGGCPTCPVSVCWTLDSHLWSMRNIHYQKRTWFIKPAGWYSRRLFCIQPGMVATYKIITQRLNINYNHLTNGSGLLLAIITYKLTHFY